MECYKGSGSNCTPVRGGRVGRRNCEDLVWERTVGRDGSGQLFVGLLGRNERDLGKVSGDRWQDVEPFDTAMDGNEFLNCQYQKT
jgi:hypothetical protein